MNRLWLDLGLQARRLAFSTTKSGDFAERGDTHNGAALKYDTIVSINE